MIGSKTMETGESQSRWSESLNQENKQIWQVNKYKQIIKNKQIIG